MFILFKYLEPFYDAKLARLYRVFFICLLHAICLFVCFNCAEVFCLFVCFLFALTVVGVFFVFVCLFICCWWVFVLWGVFGCCCFLWGGGGGEGGAMNKESAGLKIYKKAD